MRHRITIVLAVLATAAAAGLASVTPAHADTNSALADSAAIVAAGCDTAPVSQVFLPWADLSWYALLPNGGFEQGTSSWSLGGGASVVNGNESFDANDPADSRSLDLGASGKATSDFICVTPDDPTVRLFVRNDGAPTSTLKVAVRFVNTSGTLQTVTVGYVSGGSTWQPSDQIPIIVNALADVLANGSTNVSFRFTAQNDGGDWSIDDVYLDPFKTK
jgi:hypothetical protein